MAELLGEYLLRVGIDTAVFGALDAAQKKIFNFVDSVTGRIKRITDAFTPITATVTGGMMALSAVMGTVATQATMTAAKTQVMQTTLRVVGENAGYSKEKLEEYTAAVKKKGITTQEATQSIVRFIQANLDASKASNLARAAQDLAVISGRNSSETFGVLVDSISSLNTVYLNYFGLTKNLDVLLKEHAMTLKKNTTALTETEQKQAIYNYIIKESSKFTGSYEASMQDASKQLASMSRYIEEVGNMLGRFWLPIMYKAVKSVNDFLDALTKLPKWMQDLMSLTIGLGAGFGGVVTVFGALTTAIGPLINMLSNLVLAMTGIKLASIAMGFAMGKLNAELAFSMTKNTVGGLFALWDKLFKVFWGIITPIATVIKSFVTAEGVMLKLAIASKVLLNPWALLVAALTGLGFYINSIQQDIIKLNNAMIENMLRSHEWPAVHAKLTHSLKTLTVDGVRHLGLGIEDLNRGMAELIAMKKQAAEIGRTDLVDAYQKEFDALHKLRNEMQSQEKSLGYMMNGLERIQYSLQMGRITISQYRDQLTELYKNLDKGNLPLEQRKAFLMAIEQAVKNVTDAEKALILQKGDRRIFEQEQAYTLRQVDDKRRLIEQYEKEINVLQKQINLKSILYGTAKTSGDLAGEQRLQMEIVGLLDKKVALSIKHREIMMEDAMARRRQQEDEIVLNETITKQKMRMDSMMIKLDEELFVKKISMEKDYIKTRAGIMFSMFLSEKDKNERLALLELDHSERIKKLEEGRVEHKLQMEERIMAIERSGLLKRLEILKQIYEMIKGNDEQSVRERLQIQKEYYDGIGILESQRAKQDEINFQRRQQRQERKDREEESRIRRSMAVPGVSAGDAYSKYQNMGGKTPFDIFKYFYGELGGSQQGGRGEADFFSSILPRATPMNMGISPRQGAPADSYGGGAMSFTFNLGGASLQGTGQTLPERSKRAAGGFLDALSQDGLLKGKDVGW